MRATPYVLEEIHSQPQVWTECLGNLSVSASFREVCERSSCESEWLFIGCGSSYYVAQAAAATFVGLGLKARAVPASELLLYPSLVLNQRPLPQVPVLISRSGCTSEVLQAGEFLEKKEMRTIAITCAAGEPIEKVASFTLHTLPANEQSTVMTRAFTSMLLGLQLLGASVARNQSFGEALKAMPAAFAPVLEEGSWRLRDFVAEHNFEDYVFLAQGPLMGIANECSLKTMEASVSYAQSFHTMEFRHGPKSIVAKQVLTGFLLSETSYDSEASVLVETKGLGGSTLTVANVADERTRLASDFLVELGLPGPEMTRLAAYVVWGQLLGAYTGLHKGLDPDAPRHLSRVVILQGSQ